MKFKHRLGAITGIAEFELKRKWNNFPASTYIHTHNHTQTNNKHKTNNAKYDRVKRSHCIYGRVCVCANTTWNVCFFAICALSRAYHTEKCEQHRYAYYQSRIISISGMYSILLNESNSTMIKIANDTKIPLIHRRSIVFESAGSDRVWKRYIKFVLLFRVFDASQSESVVFDAQRNVSIHFR